MSNNKYPGFDAKDTFWDGYHRKNGMMTNHEFFTGTGPGTFNEGMEWNGTEWVPNAVTRQKEWERKQQEDKCYECGYSKSNCHCREDCDDTEAYE